MEIHIYNILFFIQFYIIGLLHVEGARGNFSMNYYPLWGTNHFSLAGEKDVALLFDQNSGGAGFRSKTTFTSGLFQMRIKISENRTKGVVTSFYLNNAAYGQDSVPHDEVDFEFLGTDGTLQTNVFAGDNGQREQVFQLWFDPSKDFHTYQIVWNYQQIVFIVDDIPIRVYKKINGVNFPSNDMRIEASMWDADWAGQVDWSKAPFISHYEGFNVNACSLPHSCTSSHFKWNHQSYLELSPQQQEVMREYREKHIVYDYCNTKADVHPECIINR